MQVNFKIAAFAAPALFTLPFASAQTALRSIINPVHGEYLGRALALPGDINGDGFDDIIATAPGASITAPSSGAVRAFSGRDGTLLFQRNGVTEDGSLGLQLSEMGDMNGDGIGDVITAEEVVDAMGSLRGVARILSGADGSDLYVHELGADTEAYKQIVGVGDQNGDGVPDFAVGNYDYVDSNGNGIGSVAIRSGSDAALIREYFGWIGGAGFGGRVVNMGDVTGDGIDDQAVNAVSDGGFSGGRGIVSVHSGADGSRVFFVEGPQPGSEFGAKIARIGDLNGDAAPDLLVLSGNNSTSRSSLRAISGADGATILDIPNLGFASAYGTIGAAGDLNGDGVPEIGAGYGGIGADGEGEVTIYNGVDGSVLFRVQGTGEGDNFGQAIVGGLDTKGDGIEEVVVSGTGGLARPGNVKVFRLTPPNGGTLCKGLNNSTGQSAVLTAASPSGFAASANDVTLTVNQLPFNCTGYFVVSSSYHVIPGAGGSSGRLCIASLQTGRLRNAILQSGVFGTVSYQPDMTRIPISSAMGTVLQSASPGSTYNFQLWYRHDTAQGGTTSNFSDAVTITFN